MRTFFSPSSRSIAAYSSPVSPPETAAPRPRRCGSDRRSSASRRCAQNRRPPGPRASEEASNRGRPRAAVRRRVRTVRRARQLARHGRQDGSRGCRAQGSSAEGHANARAISPGRSPGLQRQRISGPCAESRRRGCCDEFAPSQLSITLRVYGAEIGLDSACRSAVFQRGVLGSARQRRRRAVDAAAHLAADGHHHARGAVVGAAAAVFVDAAAELGELQHQRVVHQPLIAEILIEREQAVVQRGHQVPYVPPCAACVS